MGQGRGALTTNFTAGLQPFLQNYATAQGGQNAYADATGANGADGSARARANFRADPGYEYRVTQGNENVLRNASRTGQGNSGAVNLDLQKQGQGLADQGWQQYITNLQPFLGGANSAAGGLGSLYSGLGTGLNASYGTQGNAAYGTQAGIGNAQSSAELAKNSGVGNILNLGMGIAGLGSSSIGGGALRSAGSAISGWFADGGRPPAGQPAVVGERGPEIFVPDQPGTVIPNERMRSASTMTRGPNSFAERLADFLHDHRLPASLDPRDMRANPMGIAAATQTALGGSMEPNLRVQQGFEAIKDRSVPYASRLAEFQ